MYTCYAQLCDIFFIFIDNVRSLKLSVLDQVATFPIIRTLYNFPSACYLFDPIFSSCYGIENDPFIDKCYRRHATSLTKYTLTLYMSTLGEIFSYSLF